MSAAFASTRRGGKTASDIDVRGGDRWNPKNTYALAPFRAALANAKYSPCNIVWFDDSTGAGLQSASDITHYTKNPAYLVGDALRRRFPVTGDTSFPNYVPVFAGANPGVLPSGWTVTANWAQSSTFSPNALPARNSVGTGTLTRVIPAGIAAVDVLLFGTNSASLGVSATLDGTALNGGASISYTGSTAKDGWTYRITIADPSVSHTLVLTPVAANAYVHGTLEYPLASAGVRLFNISYSGTRLRQFRAIAGSNNLALFNPAQYGPTVSGGLQSWIPLNPDLVVLGHQINDFGTLTASVAYGAVDHQQMLTELIRVIRAMLPSKTIPFLLLSKWQVNEPSLSGDPWSAFTAARQAVADADPYVTHLDLGKYMPAVNTPLATQLAIYADQLHPNAKGYQMEADAVASFLAP